ncbi:MAG: hypothetical protein NTY36_03475 [Deltaproteobacteria bacterium]|nr:hypothetical protein [Deltaproteobacteria bacterium]
MNKAPHDPFLHPFSLKKTFGKRWKVKMEESWQYEKPENRTGYEGWYEQVPTACGGFIGLFQDKPTLILEFYSPKQRPTCRKLAEQFKDTPGVSLDEWFDVYETVLYFPVELFNLVAVAIGARKRRQLSEVQKEAMALGREKAGLVRDEKGRIVHSQARNTTQNEAIPTQPSK